MKPSREEMAAMVADGRAVEINHQVRAWRLPDGNLILQADDGTLLDRYLVVADRGGVLVNEERKTPLQKIAERTRQGAAGILVLLESPLAGLIETVTGRSLGKLRGITRALAQRTRLEQALALAHEVGSERARAVAAAIDKAREDGDITQEEYEMIIDVARGKA